MARSDAYFRRQLRARADFAPHGRDAEIASVLLAEAGRDTHTCADVTDLCAELKKGAAFAVITVEAVSESNLADLSAWVASQPAWSDMPIVLLTTKEDSPARVGDAARYQEVFGNVTYLERPFHPTTLVSVARSAIRSRLRQYEARASLERYMLLARELQHRTKNLLAIIQSIAAATLPAEPARECFSRGSMRWPRLKTCLWSAMVAVFQSSNWYSRRSSILGTDLHGRTGCVF